MRWQLEALITAGVIEDIASAETDKFTAAHRRTASLWAELESSRNACETADEQAAVPTSADARPLNG